MTLRDESTTRSECATNDSEEKLNYECPNIGLLAAAPSTNEPSNVTSLAAYDGNNVHHLPDFNIDREESLLHSYQARNITQCFSSSEPERVRNRMCSSPREAARSIDLVSIPYAYETMLNGSTSDTAEIDVPTARWTLTNELVRLSTYGW